MPLGPRGPTEGNTNIKGEVGMRLMKIYTQKIN